MADVKVQVIGGKEEKMLKGGMKTTPFIFGMCVCVIDDYYINDDDVFFFYLI